MIPRIPLNILPGMSGLIQQTPGMYANGFEVAITGADVVINLTYNGRPLVTLNLSFTTAKALGGALSQLVSELEAKSETKVLLSDEVVKALELPKPQ